MKEHFDNKIIQIAFMIFIIIATSIILFFTIYRWNIVVRWIINLFNILSPFLYGLLFAYILTPFIKYLENKCFKRLSLMIFKNKNKAKKFSRYMSLIISIILIIFLIMSIIYYIFPQIINSVDSLIKNIPDYSNNIKNIISSNLQNNPDLKEIIINNYDSIYNGILDWVNTSAIPSLEGMIINISHSVIGIIKTIINIIIGIIIAIYIINDKEIFISQSKKILYSIFSIEHANIILSNIRYIHKIFGNFLLGKIIDSLIIGIICFIFVYLFKMPYALLISLIIGVTNIIPYFGPFIGAIPSALLILITSPVQCLTFIIFIFILQQFDGNILGPKILGETIGLKSFWILFAIILFGGLFGFTGLIFGVPLFATIYAFVSGLCKNKLGKKGLPQESINYLNVEHVDLKTTKPVYFK